MLDFRIHSNNLFLQGLPIETYFIENDSIQFCLDGNKDNLQYIDKACKQETNYIEIQILNPETSDVDEQIVSKILFTPKDKHGKFAWSQYKHMPEFIVNITFDGTCEFI